MNLSFCRIDNYVIDMGRFLLFEINSLCLKIFSTFLNDHRLFLPLCIDIRTNIPPNSIIKFHLAQKSF